MADQQYPCIERQSDDDDEHVIEGAGRRLRAQWTRSYRAS